MMLQLVFVSVFLLGAVIGWLVVYFVRKYKEYNPKVLEIPWFYYWEVDAWIFFCP